MNSVGEKKIDFETKIENKTKTFNFKFRVAKIHVWLLHYFRKKPKMNVLQEKGYEIVKLLYTKNCELLIEPKTETRYVSYEGTYVELKDNSVFIANHNYAYEIIFPNSIGKELIRIFDKKITRSRFQMEKDIRKNIYSSLTYLADGLKVK